MDKNNVYKKDSKNIHKEIKKINKIKEKLTKKEGYVFCPICKKLYPEEKCRHDPKTFGSIKKWQNTCPIGHNWDTKHN